MGVLSDLLSCTKKIKQLETDLNAARKECETLKAQLELAKKTILSYEHYKSVDRYKTLPTMESLIESGLATDKDTSDYCWKREFTRQTGIQIIENPGSVEQKTCQFVPLLGSHRWRIPKNIFKEIMGIIPVNEWTYTPLDKYNRTFVCADFATATWAEINRGPFWDIWFGIVLISPNLHLLNIVWFSDDEKFYYFEPQNDTLSPIVQRPNEPPVRIVL